MFTLDAQCSRCAHRQTPQHIPETPCTNRAEIIGTLSDLVGRLNAEPLVDGPGDGMLIVACSDFKVA